MTSNSPNRSRKAEDSRLGPIDQRDSQEGLHTAQTKKQLPRAAFFLLPLFVLVGFQVRMVLLLFRGDSLPFVRSAIFIGALWAWLDAHAKLPFPLGLLNAAM